MTIYVQFDRPPFETDGVTPDMSAIIIAYAVSPQRLETWPFQSEVDASDERWKTYYDAQSEDLKTYLPMPD